MASSIPCTACGRPRAGVGELEGLCPACLLGGAAAPLAAVRIPGLRILEKIGEGGMGEVYRAEQVDLKRTVALKVLSPVAVAGPGAAERLLKEARAAARIADPHVVSIFDVGRVGSRAYIVMEYVDGTPLDRLMREARIPHARARRIMAQSLQAVAAAHENGIIHRDIKPSNLLVTPRGVVKLADFGLARAAGGADSAVIPVGTPKYMSPEQARGEKVDARSDLYSLGVVYYEMLAGRHPYVGDSPNAFLVQHADPKTKPPPLREVPAGLTTVVAGLLQKDRDRRYATARQALDALNAPAPPSRRAIPWILVGGFAVLLLAIGASLPWTTPGRAPGPDVVEPIPDPDPVEDPVDLAAARDLLIAHWESTRDADAASVAAALSLLRDHADSDPAHEAFAAHDRIAGALLKEAEAAFAEDRLDEAETAARRAQDRFMDPWKERAARIAQRVGERRAAAVKPDPIPLPDDPFERPPAIVELPFLCADGVYASDGEAFLIVDADAGDLVRWSVADGVETHRARLDRGAAALAGRGKTVYVACRDSGSILAFEESDLSLKYRLTIPQGRPSALAAPPRDPERLYAVDGERFYTIDAGKGTVRQSLEFREKTIPPSFQPEVGMELVADPDGMRFYGWSDSTHPPSRCFEAGRDAGADSVLLADGRELRGGTPIGFDAQGMVMFDYAGGVIEPDRTHAYASLESGTIVGTHPDLPWAVLLNPRGSLLSLYDLHAHAIHRSVVVRWKERPLFPFQDSPAYRIEIRPDGAQAALIPRTWGLGSIDGRRRSFTLIHLFALPEEGRDAGRLASPSRPPKRAPIGFPMEAEITLCGSLAAGATTELVEGPTGMTYDAEARRLRWTPALTQRGTHKVRLALRSGRISTELVFRVEADLRKLDWTVWKDRNAGGFHDVRVSRNGEVVYITGPPRKLLVYSIDDDAGRIVDAGSEIRATHDLDDTIYVVTPDGIRAVSMDRGDAATPWADVPDGVDLWPFLETTGGKLPLVIQTKGESGTAYFAVSNSGRPRPYDGEITKFDTWLVAPGGKTMFGAFGGAIRAVDVGGREPRELWAVGLPGSVRGSLTWMPDYKRICFGNALLSAEDGSTIAETDRLPLEPDPTGRFVAGWRGGRVTIHSDKDLTELASVALTGVRVSKATPVGRKNRLVIIGDHGVYVLPYAFDSIPEEDR